MSIKIKGLEEARNAKKNEMDQLLQKAVSETRSFTDEEKQRFDALEQEVKNLQATIDAAKRRNEEDAGDPEDPSNEPNQEGKQKAANEERAFANHIRGIAENRAADVNMTQGDNGAVIPATVANKIIELVHEISPIVKLSSTYNVSGNLVIPKYDEKSQNITVAYADEFTELTSSAGKFASVELKDFLYGALTKVSRSLINKTGFNLTAYVVRKMAEAITVWLEGQLLYGTEGKIVGLDGGVTQIVTAASATAVTADELIDLQEAVPDAFQNGAIWIMSRATRKAIRKLKDGDGTYLLQKDATAKWGYTLYGKDVYVSENMKDMAAGVTSIFYGDMSGLALKISEKMSVQVLREKYATQHAIGVVGWMEADAKVEHEQKVAKLKMKAD